MSGMHACVWQWLQGCPHIRDLFFSFAHAEAGDTVLVPLTGAEDAELRRYIDGTSERRYTFSLIRFDVLTDAPNDARNLRVLLDAEKIAEWIGDQRAAGAFPALPEGCLPLDMRPEDDGAFAAPDGDRVEYVFRFTIDYLKTA